MTEPQPADPSIMKMPLDPDSPSVPHYPVKVTENPLPTTRFKSVDPNEILPKDIESLTTRSNTPDSPFQTIVCIELAEEIPLDSGRPMLLRVRPAEIQLPKGGFKTVNTNKVAPFDIVCAKTRFDPFQSPSKKTAASWADVASPTKLKWKPREQSNKALSLVSVDISPS
jgi:hypothetical protein